MTIIKQILKDKKGNGMPLAAAVTLVLLLIILMISQYVQLLIVSAGVKDALQKAVISVVNDNYADVYHAVREGYAGGYQPSGGNFIASVDEGDVYRRLEDLLGLQASRNGYSYINSKGKMEYQLSDLNVSVSNTPLASGNKTEFIVTGQVELQMPLSFVSKIIPNMKIILHMKAAYTPKF